MPTQDNRVLRHSLHPGWTGPMWGRTGLQAEGWRTDAQRHGTTQTVTEPGLSTVTQVAPFQAFRLSPWTGIFSAQQGKDSLMLPQSSRHRGEYVLGAAVCYKYTSESENQMPPARQPVCPAAPWHGVQSLPDQPRAAYFSRQSHLTKAGWMGRRETNVPLKVAVTLLEDC